MNTKREEKSVLLFYVNGVLCMLPISSVSSVGRPHKNIVTVPNMPSYMCGIYHISNQKIPLVDLAKILNFHIYKKNAISPSKTSIIILDEKIALFTEKVVGVDLMEHFQKTIIDIPHGKMVNSLYMLGTSNKERYHIQDADTIIFQLNLSEIFKYIHNIYIHNGQN